MCMRNIAALSVSCLALYPGFVCIFELVMANLVAGGLQSLAVHREQEGASTAKLQTAWSEVDGLKMKEDTKTACVVLMIKATNE